MYLWQEVLCTHFNNEHISKHIHKVHSLNLSRKGINSYTSPLKSQKISLTLKIWRMPILTMRLDSGAYIQWQENGVVKEAFTLGVMTARSSQQWLRDYYLRSCLQPMKGLGVVTPPQHGASDEGETEGSYNIPHLNVVIIFNFGPKPGLTRKGVVLMCKWLSGASIDVAFSTLIAYIASGDG